MVKNIVHQMQHFAGEHHCPYANDFCFKLSLFYYYLSCSSFALMQERPCDGKYFGNFMTAFIV